MIELAGVRLERPRAAAPLLSGVDLAVHRGDVVLITGGAGAGTSTLLAALVGDVPPAEGTIALFGRDLARLRLSSLLALRRRLGVVPQDLQLLPECTALDNVELPLEIDHVPRRDAGVRAAAALGRLGLGAEADTPVAELPFGARQRVAVARALVRAPTVILADQPTSHQDADGAELIAAVLAAAAADGAAVLVTGRDPHLVAAAGRRGWRQLVIHDGRLIDVGDLAGLIVPSDAEDAEIEIAIDDEAVVAETEIAAAALAALELPAPAAAGAGAPAAAPTPAPAVEPGAAVAFAVPNVIAFPVPARSRGAR